VRRKNNESGMILPMVVIFALALTITGMAFLNMAVMEHNLAMRGVHKTQAFYLAEAGIEHARVKLGDNWDLTSIDETPLGEGTYIVDIYNTEAGDGDLLDPEHDSRRRIRSTGAVKEVTQIVQAIVRQLPSSAEIDAVLESGGIVEVASNAVTVSGLVRAKEAIIDKHEQITDEDIDAFLFDNPDAYFEEIFNATKDQMMEMAKRNGIYYEDPGLNAPVHKITWVEAPEEPFHIASDTWSGEGILIVNGDLKITGGDFNGIIWVTGNISVGNPVITGTIFVEGSTTVDIGGKVKLIYDKDVIDEAIQEIGTLPWIEPGTWEQLK